MRLLPLSWVGAGLVVVGVGCSSEAPSLVVPEPPPTASSEPALEVDAGPPDALAPHPTPGDAGAKDSGAKDAGGTPPVGNGAQDLCVAEINKWRATEGLPPLARWKDAEVCVDGQCKSDSLSGTAHGAFGTCGEQAQNECPGWPGKPETMIAGCLKMMWDEKFGTGQQGHYINMKNTRYTKVACGFYVTPAGKVWAIQNFRP